jgi:NAD(P)-dependent dehydrogenase (short-subunit alcohol dehydrogenase family)
MTEHPVALVTGGSRGVGKAIALRLAREGMVVVTCGTDPDELKQAAAEIDKTGPQCLARIADISREEQVHSLVEEARLAYGRIDVLVNNAAVIGPTAPVASVNRQEWDAVLAVNLTGAFLCCKAVLPVMMNRRSGRIINISSIAGKIGYALRSPYAVSKWGLLGLTLTLAKEVGPYNITVNAICPGPVSGPRMDNIINQRAAELGQTPAQVEKTYLQTTLLSRFVNAEHVAELVALLVSPAGDSMTGQILDISAGYGL